MADRTYKMTTLVGESEAGIEQAVLAALGTSAEKVHGQTWCEITDLRANINEHGTVDAWQVKVQVAFEVDA
jgi:flavin-binding protein dodecin